MEIRTEQIVWDGERMYKILEIVGDNTIFKSYPKKYVEKGKSISFDYRNGKIYTLFLNDKGVNFNIITIGNCYTVEEFDEIKSFMKESIARLKIILQEIEDDKNLWKGEKTFIIG